VVEAHDLGQHMCVARVGLRAQQVYGGTGCRKVERLPGQRIQSCCDASSAREWWLRCGEWVWLAGKGGKRGGYLVEVGADVDGGASVVSSAVASVGAGHGVAKVAPDPGQCGVPKPMGC
jgi:hypothetical protein